MSDTLHDWLSAEPFALALSSGFFGFFAHAGMLSALEDAGLSPVRLAGSSAGALVAGLSASGLSAAHMSDELRALKREDFWDPALGFGLLAGKKFVARIATLVGDKTFADCRVPLAVSVFDVHARATRVLDTGPIASAIVASCALPGLFHPVSRDGRLYIDGGVADRPGIRGIAAGTRTLQHNLASKSPWRYRRSPSLRAPRRDNLVALVIDGIPRVGPFRLPEGRRAFAAAFTATQRALTIRIKNGVVSTSV